jgi:hypothetical protein
MGDIFALDMDKLLFFRLHFEHAETTFSQQVAPPLDFGITWSKVKSDVLKFCAQYWH